LTVGGRLNDICPQDKCPDFTWVKDVTLQPNESYDYKGDLPLKTAGDYHFFTAYMTKDGQWNTAIPTIPGVTNTKDIFVESTPITPSFLMPFEEGVYTHARGFKSTAKPGFFHLGKDYCVQKAGRNKDGSLYGTPFYAIGDGTVVDYVFKDWEYKDPNRVGNYITIDHGKGVVAVYMHLAKVYVSKGQKVTAQTLLGEAGDVILHTSGPDMCPHLHLEIRKNGEISLNVPPNCKYGYISQDGKTGLCKGAKPFSSQNDVLGWIDVNFYDPDSILTPRGAPSQPPSIGLATALVIDHSGSMRDQNKLKKAQEAARCYIDSLPPDDWASIAAFSTSGHSVVELLPVTQKEKLKTGVFSLSPTASTNIGAGLDVGLSQLFSKQIPKEPVILLLSDGMHNTGELWPSVEKCRNKKVKVYTVAFGSDADQTTLCKIAYQTGGQCSPAGLKNLSHVYYKVNTQVHNNSTLFSCNDFLKPGQALSYKIPVESDVRDIAFFSNWQGSKIQMSIIDPHGKRLIPAQGVGKYEEGATYSLFETQSQPGIWQVELQGFGLPQEGEQVNISVSGKSDLYTNFLTFQPEYTRSQNVLIAFEIAEIINSQKMSLQDVRVKAEVQKPSTKIYQMVKSGQIDWGTLLEEFIKHKSTIDLYDDGLHEDYQSGDGIYANTFTGVDVNGPYLITLLIEGKKSNGESITRKVVDTFQVGPIEKNELTVSETIAFLAQALQKGTLSPIKIFDDVRRKVEELLKRKRLW